MNNEEKILGMLVNLTEKVDSIDDRLGRVETVQAKQGEQLAALQSTQAKQGEQLAALQSTQAKQGELLDSMDKRLSQVESVQAKQGELLEILDARSLKSAVLLETDVARDIHLLYEGHSVLKKKLDTLATKEQVEELACDVDIIKEVVSRHSSDINRLKKAQ